MKISGSSTWFVRNPYSISRYSQTSSPENNMSEINPRISVKFMLHSVAVLKDSLTKQKFCKIMFLGANCRTCSDPECRKISWNQRMMANI